MSELKTLKDLLKHSICGPCCGKIREEARKHLESMIGPKHDHSTCYPSQLCDECESQSAIDFIKEFFNLKEE